MKTMFIEANYNKPISLPAKVIDKLPHTIVLVTSVQFINQMSAIKRDIEASGRKVILAKGSHALHPGQILGCSTQLDIHQQFDAFLFIGDGLFHPKALMKYSQPVYCFDPINNEFKELAKADVERMARLAKGAMLKFLHATEVGILVTTKPGQQRLRQAQAIKSHFKDKKFYIIVFDSLDYGELENFPFIEVFINTACPRLAFDDYAEGKFTKPVLAMEELAELMGKDIKF